MHVGGAIALIALAVVVGSLGWLHLQPTGLSPLRNAVSQYGITPFKSGYRVATLAFAAAGLALAFAVRGATDGRASVTIVLLVVFALARAAISWFPMDAPGAERSGTGQAHGLLAMAAFLGAAVAALRLARVLAHQATLRSLAPVSTILGVLMVACLIGMALGRSAPAVRARFGLVERGFYLAAIAWFAVIAIGCLVAGHG